MDLGLQGKVALVTGAGSQVGFGKAIALTLAKEGCDIIVADMNLEGARQTAAEVQSLGRKASAFKANLTNSVEVNNMFKTVLEQFNQIHILVNNAGAISPSRPFVEKSEADWEFDININLKSVLNCTKAILPHMLSRKTGKIINISSATGINGAASASTYAAAKAAIIAFTKSLALEVASSGINVNSVAPGFSQTNFANNDPPEFVKFMVNRPRPIGRLTLPQDVANMVAVLASDISSDVVGQIIAVSGNL